jgi:hypothetical protein
VRKGLRIDPENASLLDLDGRISHNAWTYFITGYLTLLDYNSPIKDKGNSRSLLISGTYKNTHTFDFAISGLGLEFVTPGVPRLKERAATIGYHWSGPVLASFLFSDVATTDQVLGKGRIGFAKLERGPWFTQGGASSYQGATASQWGIGHRWWRGKYSLTSVAEVVSRKEITSKAARKTYGVFSQKHRVDLAPWAISMNYSLGKSSLLLREHGYVAYNSPEELDFIGGAGAEYTNDWGTIGYQIGYVQGVHLTDPAKREHHSFSHTLSYSQRW